MPHEAPEAESRVWCSSGASSALPPLDQLKEKSLIPFFVLLLKRSLVLFIMHVVPI